MPLSVLPRAGYHKEVITLPPLPIVEHLPEIRRVLASNAPLILDAPPGTGKTTVMNFMNGAFTATSDCSWRTWYAKPFVRICASW